MKLENETEKCLAFAVMQMIINRLSRAQWGQAAFRLNEPNVCHPIWDIPHAAKHFRYWLGMSLVLILHSQSWSPWSYWRQTGYIVISDSYFGYQPIILWGVPITKEKKSAGKGRLTVVSCNLLSFRWGVVLPCSHCSVLVKTRGISINQKLSE